MNNDERLLVCVAVLIVVALSCLVGYTIANAQEPVTCPQVCPSCNVKAEWTDEGYQYEYTDNTAVITGTTPISVCWQATSGYQVSGVCIKAGQMLFWPEPSDGCWQTHRHDISHVVVCTEEVTAIRLVKFTAMSGPQFSTMLFFIGCVGMMSGLCIIAWVERRRHGRT